MNGYKEITDQIIYANTLVCTRCNGVISGQLRSTIDFYCKCPIGAPQHNPLQGWECPRCHRMHSPYVTECWCPPAIRVSTST